MDTLPGEILHLIFTKLDIVHKLECLIMCKRWHEKISTRILFPSVICHDRTSFASFMNIMGKRPTFSDHVKYLTVKRGSTDVYDMESVLQKFPNLHQVSYSAVLGSEQASELATGSLTNSNVFSQLVTLDLSLCFSNSSVARLDDIYESLKNMPVLKNLDLEVEYTTIGHCETIHKYAPTITNLILGCVDYNTGDTFPEDINPATRVNTLSLNMVCSGLEAQDRWFTYVARKYSQLQDFSFQYDDSCDDEEGIRYFQVNLPMLTRSLGSRLTSLCVLDVPVDTAIFNVLDGSGCEITVLEVNLTNPTAVDALCRSNQANHIENLKMPLNISSSLNWLNRMGNINSLSLMFMTSLDAEDTGIYERDTIIDAIALFQSFPNTIESVSISCGFSSAPLYFYHEQIHLSLQFPSITKLAFTDWKPPYGINRFIPICFPSLYSLDLNFSVKDGDLFNFQNLHFSNLNLYCYNPPRDSYINVKTLDGNKSCYCSLSKPSPWKFDNHINPTQKSDEEKCWVVICGSVEKLTINDIHASRD